MRHGLDPWRIGGETMNKSFWKSALIRALRTFCQSLVTLIGTDAINIVDIEWLTIIGIAATTAVMSILTSIATGLPESDI